MTFCASSCYSQEPDSEEAGRLLASALRREFGAEPLRTVLVYATVNHDQEALLATIQGELGPNVTLVGSSVQGIVSNDELTEEGVAAGAMGLGGSSLSVSIAQARDIEVASFEKGREMGAALKASARHDPKLVVILYDPLCGADVEALLQGLHGELKCPVIGGAAGQPWGRPVRTYQYLGTQVFSKGAIAFSLSGPFGVEFGVSHGTVPTGVTITVTKSEGPRILEIDGRRATDVWCEQTGVSPTSVTHQEMVASWAIGVERRIASAHAGGDEVVRLIRGAFGLDFEAGAVILQAAVPEGAKVMFYHREVARVLEGTQTMAAELVERLRGKAPWAVLGFECAARTFPFLGPSNTRTEHRGLRETVAPTTPWLGMMAWGEIAPLGGEPAFLNYTYPLAVLTR